MHKFDKKALQWDTNIYCSLSITDTRLFDLEIRSNYPEWFSEGMEIFPYAFRSLFLKLNLEEEQ